MAKFNYKARTEKGKTKSGVVEASSREAALNVLRKYGLYVTELDLVTNKSFLTKDINPFARISTKEVVNFTRQLSIMFRSKVPLVDALRALATQWENPKFKRKIAELSEEVEGGSSLSEALSHFPGVFSQFYVTMVKSGEASGKLSETLTYLAEYLERKDDLNSKIKGAATYPAFIIGVIIVILVLMVYFVFPRLESVLKEASGTLPAMTKITLNTATFLRHWGWLLMLLFIGGIWGISYYFKNTESGQERWSRFSLQLPLFGKFLKKMYLSRFARNLSTLIKGGLPISQALEITSTVVGNTAYQEVVIETRNEVRRGEDISSVLAKYPDLIPPLVIQMVSVGEKTGTVDESLSYVVDFYQKEVERFADNLLNLLEPILIVFLGIVVGFVVITVFVPLYRLQMGAI